MGDRRLRQFVVVSALLLGTACPPGGGGTPGIFASTAVTGWYPLVNGAGQGLSGVEAKCALTLGPDGSLKADCAFRNNTNQAKRFLYCHMLDLKSGSGQGASIPGIAGKHKSVVKNGNSVQCNTTSSGGGSDTSWHFGCREVNLGAGPGTTTTVAFESGGTYEPPDGKVVAAWDFQVNYGDAVDLQPLGGVTFDTPSCTYNAGEAQGGFLVPQVAGTVNAIWVVVDAPFIDPYVSYQPVGREPGSKQYTLFEDSPCQPREFPVKVALLKPCPEPPVELPPTLVDVNLFSYETHSAGEGSEFSFVIRVRPTGKTRDLRIDVEPEPDEVFAVPGGKETFGKLRVCAAQPRDNCVAPSDRILKEGDQLEVLLLFEDQQGRPKFLQGQRFIQDTEPPRVEKATVDGDGNVEVVASDETTAPLAAVLWYSGNEGETWTQLALEGEGSLLTDELSHRRAFRGKLVRPESVRFFVTVQDQVSNLVYYGVDEA